MKAYAVYVNWIFSDFSARKRHCTFLWIIVWLNQGDFLHLNFWHLMREGQSVVYWHFIKNSKKSLFEIIIKRVYGRSLRQKSVLKVKNLIKVTYHLNTPLSVFHPPLNFQGPPQLFFSQNIPLHPKKGPEVHTLGKHAKMHRYIYPLIFIIFRVFDNMISAKWVIPIHLFYFLSVSNKTEMDGSNSDELICMKEK